jgi:hypothetical protein
VTTERRMKPNTSATNTNFDPADSSLLWSVVVSMDHSVWCADPACKSSIAIVVECLLYFQNQLGSLGSGARMTFERATQRPEHDTHDVMITSDYKHLQHRI